MEIVTYVDAAGKIPFREWLYALQDKTGQKNIAARIARLAAGNFGDCKPVRDGVQELKVDHGPGYRGLPEPPRASGCAAAAVRQRQGRAKPGHQTGH